ncbi:unnamed protein product [Closterium sp. NIES-54]
MIDSGATYSMIPRAYLLTELEPSPVKHVTSALGQRAEVKGMGKAIFKGADGKMVGLKNVLWVPNLAANLISIPVVPMPKERQVAASISTKGEAVGSGDGANGRAKEIESKKCNLEGTTKLGEHEERGAAAKKQQGEENPKAAAEEYGENMWGTNASAAFSNPTSATGECDWLTLHWRMGRVALPILQQLVKNEMVSGIRVKGEPDEVLGYPTGMQAKFTHYPFSSSEATAKAPLDEVVMDVVGPLKLGAARAEYFLTIVDVYTRMTWVYVLSKKSDVAETVKTDWLPMVERQQDRLVKAIRTDRGGEFLSKEFSLWLKKNGIRHSLTMPYSPAMNGIAERANRTITETARGLFIEAGLPDYFWPDAVRSACVAKNRALTHVGADKWVPYVEWIGRKPKVDMLRVFGCMCMALVPKHLRHNKLGAKAIWAVHLGMAQHSKGWLLWDPFTKKFLAPRQWYLKLRGVLEEIGFTPSTADHSLFMLGEGEQRSFMVVYVDDILIFSPSSDLVKEVMLKLKDKFKCKALGDVSFYLGLHIERDVEKRCMRCVYHPTSRRVLPSHNVTFDESVPFCHLFPYRSAPPPPPPLFLAPGSPSVDPLLPQGPSPSRVSQVDPLLGTAPVQVVVVSGAAPGAASGGAEPGGAGSEGARSGGAEPEGFEPGGAESEGAELGGAESEGAESGGAEPRGAASPGGPAGALPRLSPQQLREWLVWHPHRWGGAPGAGGAGDAGAGGTVVPPGAVGTGGVGCAGAGDPTEPGGAGAVGAGAGVARVGGPGAGGAGAAGAGVGGTGAGGAGAAGTGAVDPGAGGAGDTVRPRPNFVPLLQQVLGVPSTGLPPPFLCPPSDQSQPLLQPASPLPAPCPYTEQSRGLTERREPASRPVLPVRTARCAPRSRPPPIPGTHTMALRPSSIPLCVPLPAPPESSLPKVPDPESHRARAASPNVARVLATAVTDPYFESAAASALVAELLDFAAACRLDYATALVAESVSASPPSVGGECALGTDVLEDRQEDFECLAAAVPRFASMLLAPEGDPDAPDILTPRSYAEAMTGPYSSQWQAAMNVEMASWKSTGTYVDEVPPPGANIVDGMWIFRVKRPPGSPPAFKAHYVA